MYGNQDYLKGAMSIHIFYTDYMNVWCSRPKISWQSSTAKERYVQYSTARIFDELCNKCGIYFVDTRGTNRAVNRC